MSFKRIILVASLCMFLVYSKGIAQNVNCIVYGHALSFIDSSYFQNKSVNGSVADNRSSFYWYVKSHPKSFSCDEVEGWFSSLMKKALLCKSSKKKTIEPVEEICICSKVKNYSLVSGSQKLDTVDKAFLQLNQPNFFIAANVSFSEIKFIDRETLCFYCVINIGKSPGNIYYGFVLKKNNTSWSIIYSGVEVR